LTERSTSEHSVRIGELQVRAPGSATSLVAVGLGSCVGVVVLDERSGACALAHVFLPRRPLASAPGDRVGIGTYADEAVPELVRLVREASGAPDAAELVAIVAGGSCMFEARAGADVGTRNVEAVREMLAAHGVPLVSEDVGGAIGRTLRIECGAQVDVSVRLVGTIPRVLWSVRTTGTSEQQHAA
jgi:chemotaxis protein CheD